LCAGAVREGRTLHALRVNSGWTENGVTWGNQPSTTGSAAAAPSRSSAGTVEWIVTAQLQAAYDAGAHNGFLIRDAVEGADAEQQFNSRESGLNRPQLVVTFGLPDTAAPETAIDSGPPATTTSRNATLAFSASEAGSTFECSLDGAAFAACTSPQDYTGLAVGDHEVQVRATDPAGNVDDSPASRTWTVEADTTAPETTMGSGAPPASTTSTSATFSFSSPEAGVTFECSLDTAAFASCASPKAYSGLTTGSHQFRVRARDGAGNVDTTPETHNWTVTAAAPSCTTATASADRDSWVLQSDAAKNFGTDSILKVDSKSGNSNARALVRFALPPIPAGCKVTGATLRLYASSYKSGRTLQALRLNGSWTESAVAWSNQPTTTGSAATAPSRSSAGYVDWTVTSHVTAMYGTNHGFLIRDASESGGGFEQGFNSREKGADNPPRLVITYGAL
jgi:hypothetical protein